MPSDSYSSSLRILLMGDGNDNNTWGQLTNTNLGLFEDALTKRVDLSLGGLGTGTQQYTPTSANGASDSTRCLSYSATGVLNGNVQVILPNVPKIYIFDNKTTGAFSISLQTAAPSSTVVCAQGIATIVYLDGQNNAKAVQSLGNAASLSVSQSWTAGQAVTPVAFSEGTPTTIDASLSNNFYGTLTANRTFAITNIKDGEELNIVVKQGGAGSFVPTWPANVVWVNGITPTWSTAVGASDKVRLQYFSTLNLYFGEALLNYNPVATPVFAVTLGNQHNVSLFEQLGSPAASVTVSVTVPVGVSIRTMTTVDPSLDLSGFTAGSTINLYNFGSILGRGGNGSHGGSLSGTNATGVQEFKWPNDAQAGGDAIKGPGAGNTFNVTNATGFIFGGGGGGGGGGFQAAGGGVNQDVAGGGGGGGAGGGTHGEGGCVTSVASTLPGAKLKGGNGTDGGYMHTSSAGTGGTKQSAESPTAGYDGGNGGAYGAAGSDGAGTTTYSGAGGAAGKAINLNGGTVTFISGNDATHVKGAVA